MTDLTRERLAELRERAEQRTVLPEHDIILALLAERDGLKQSAETNLANAQWALASRERLDEALSASNAALADALGLLRKVDAGDIHESDPTWSFVLLPDKVLVDISGFLAKHGPSP